MSMKDFKHLIEDAATNEELAKKLEEADKEMRRTGDKAGFIKTAAELGYEVTEQDFPGDDLVKLDEEQLDDVAGGWFGLGTEAEDEHEIGCIYLWYKDVNPVLCSESSSGKHGFDFCYDETKKVGERSIPTCKIFKCKYCGTTARRTAELLWD